jgi:hypothetical protein
MTTTNNLKAEGSPPLPIASPMPTSTATIAAGIICWAAISLGFLGLKMLMEKRPEFVGQPVVETKAELVQESPRIFTRKVSDDVSVVKPMQPELSDVRFDMSGRRDYRGLRTVMDMAGEFHGRYVLTNTFDEPIFVLFKCPHPRTDRDTGSNLLAAGLRLQSSLGGAQENSGDAWLWSGTLDAHSGTAIDISYQAAALKGVTYRVGEQNGNPVKQLLLTFHRQDLGSMRFGSGDGAQPSRDATVTWERKDFLAPDFFSASIVESRNLYASLSQLLDIGPLLCLLFLLSMAAVITARQALSALQMVTIATVYALYFPLILYLSARFSFPVALVIAAVVPGALLVNYARWLLGGRYGLVGGPVFLALYWVFPTLAAFAGWNRGLVLLCLGLITLWVLISLQNRALRRKSVTATMLILLALPGSLSAAEVQVILPAELAANLPAAKKEVAPSVVAFEPAHYQIRQEANLFLVEAQVPFRVLRAGETTVPLFATSVYLTQAHVESAETNLAEIAIVTNRLALYVQRAGPGAMRFSYRVPIQDREGKKRAEIPLLTGVSADVQLESLRGDCTVLSGNLWAKNSAENKTTYDIGVAGEDSLIVEWRENGDAPTNRTGAALTNSGNPAEGAKEFYGIGLTHALNLTVINSDGSCTHFSEFELPAFQPEEFRMKLPPKARLISVSLNGSEINAPVLEDQVCHIKLPGREAHQTAHRLSFRIAYPPLRLGFIGTAELTLPEVFQTTGTMEWVVALPNNFQTQVIASGLEAQKAPPDLGRFGDYGRILQSHAHTYLAKDLAPPGVIELSLKYRQDLPGIYGAQPLSNQ